MYALEPVLGGGDVRDVRPPAAAVGQPRLKAGAQLARERAVLHVGVTETGAVNRPAFHPQVTLGHQDARAGEVAERFDVIHVRRHHQRPAADARPPPQMLVRRQRPAMIAGERDGRRLLLMKIALTDRPPSRLPRQTQRRQQHRDQRDNQRDDHEQLDQREGAVGGHGSTNNRMRASALAR